MVKQRFRVTVSRGDAQVELNRPDQFEDKDLVALSGRVSPLMYDRGYSDASTAVFSTRISDQQIERISAKRTKLIGLDTGAMSFIPRYEPNIKVLEANSPEYRTAHVRLKSRKL